MPLKFRRKSVLIAFVALAVLITFVPVLNAATEGSEDSGSHNSDSYFRYTPSCKADSQPGKIGIMEADSEYSYEFKAFEKLPVKLSLDNKYIGIENTTEVELPAHLAALTTDIETTLPFFNLEKTYLRLGVSPSFYGEDWDFEASQFRIPSRYFLIRQPNEQWTFIAGLAVYPDFERKVLPILGFIYKPNQRLTFNIVPKRPNISYVFNDRVTLFAEGGFLANSEFEVTKDNLKNVVLRYQERRLGLGIKYKVNKFIRAGISAGGAFNRCLQYRGSLGKVKIKDSGYAEFRLEAKI